MKPDEYISIFAIYERPRDHPDHFVVREWRVFGGRTEPVPSASCALFDTLDAARQPLMERGFQCLNRTPDDDENIVETWL